MTSQTAYERLKAHQTPPPIEAADFAIELYTRQDTTTAGELMLGDEIIGGLPGAHGLVTAIAIRGTEDAPQVEIVIAAGPPYLVSAFWPVRIARPRSAPGSHLNRVAQRWLAMQLRDDARAFAAEAERVEVGEPS